MDDAMPMRLFERQSDLVEKVRDQREGDLRIDLLEIRKRLAVKILHDQVRHVAFGGFCDAKIRDVDDVGMAQTAAGLRFALEAGEKLWLRRPFRSDHFERDDPSGSEVRGQIDVPHAARAKLLVDAVFAVEDFAG